MKKDDTRSAYYDDLREKSALARSAKSAARLKYARRTREYTRKELEAMNCPTYSVNLKEPITYEKFKAIPKDLQKVYLDEVFKNYRIGPSAIARMFGISNQYCGKLLRDLGYSFPTRASRKAEAAFAAFCEGHTTQATVKFDPPIVCEPVIKGITFTCPFTEENIIKIFKQYFSIGEKISVSVSISD